MQQSIVSDLTKCMLHAADAFFPNHFVTIRKACPAWLTGDLKKLIRTKTHIHAKSKRSGRPADRNIFKNIRNHMTSKLRLAREKYRSGFLSRLSAERCSFKSGWTICNKVSVSNRYIQTYHHY